MANDIKLRDYQANGVKMLNDAIRNGYKRICWVFPTGAGKSSVTSYYVKKCVQAGKRVLFFVHSKELVVQFGMRLSKQFHLNSGVIMAGVSPARHLPVQVASIQTLVRRAYPPADIIFIDEAHRSKANTYQKVIKNYPNAIIVGLTATPFRGDGKGLGDIFETIVHPVRIRDLIEKKYLVPTKVFASANAANMEGVMVKRGEYDTSEMQERFTDGTVTRGVIDNYLQHANGKKAIVFNVNVEHSKEMNDLFNEAGIQSAHLDGTTDKRIRDRVVKDFAKGKYKVLHNVGLFCEGFDVPDTECVILNRATKSLGLYCQMVGRVLRPIWNENYTDWKRDENGNYSKTHGIVLDHGDNTIRHGFVEDYDGIPFDLEGVKKAKRKKNDEDKVVKTKVCETCRNVNFKKAKICKHCDTAFPVRERTISFADGQEFVFMERNALIVDRLMKINPNDIKGKIPASQLRIYAMLKNYKRGWWFHNAIDLKYFDINKSHPAAFDQVRLLLEMEEIKSGTHDLYLEFKGITKSVKRSQKTTV